MYVWLNPLLICLRGILSKDRARSETAFLEGCDFEDVIRTAVSLGGDCDTLTAIAGSMAEAFYGIPEDMKAKCIELTPDDMHAVMKEFDKIAHAKKNRWAFAFIRAEGAVSKVGYFLDSLSSLKLSLYIIMT